MIGLKALVVLALIGVAASAPWRCIKQEDGSVVCFGEPCCPDIGTPQINIGRLCPPCVDPATVYTPVYCPPGCQPCPPPYEPCPPGCEPCPPPYEPCPPGCQPCPPPDPCCP